MKYMGAAPAKPELLPLISGNIPPVLRAIPAWVGYKLVFKEGRKGRPGRWTKRPVDIKIGGLAESDNAETWCDFETAVRNYERMGCDGIGLCRTGDLIFIDLDGILDAYGKLLPLPWVAKILCVIRGRTYQEKSTTGTGLHAIGRGTLPPGRRQFDEPGRDHTGYALYDRNRFFTFCGHVLPDSGDICSLTEDLAALHADLFPPKVPSVNGIGARPLQTLSLSDGELFYRARYARDGCKFSRLWSGDSSGYPSPSEADLALCNILAFWTGRDQARMDSLFRQSALMRDKWERSDYRENTIELACQTTTEAWSPKTAGNRLPMMVPDTIETAYAGGENEPPTASDAAPPDWPEPPMPTDQTNVRQMGRDVDDLPRICANGRQLPAISDAALEALQSANDPPELFARGGAMVAVIRDENHRHVIAEVSVDSLCGRMARSAHYFKVGKKDKEGNSGEYDCPPPLVVVKDILALPPERWGFQSLSAVTESPIVRSDGSVLDTWGYDLSTKLYYAPDPNLRMPPIPERPTQADIQAARKLIHEAIGEFPYADDASYANTIAAILTPIVKPAIEACAPLGLFDAPQAGTGKSLLCDVVAIVATAQAGQMFKAPKDEDEWRKVITTALMSGTAVVIFDNVTRPLESGDLCSLLTSTTWADRAMRTHNKIALPVKTTFLASGNNVRLGGDMPRRCYRIRLDAKCSQPFLRMGPAPGKPFAIEDLKAWALEHRGELLAALLTLTRAWYAAGKPKPKVKPLGGFEPWTIIVGGILEHAGIEGFMGNAAALYAEADDECRDWEGFLLALHDIFYSQPFTVAEIVETLNDKTWVEEKHCHIPAARALALKAALPGRLAGAMDRAGSFQTSVGKALAAKADRRFGDSGVYLKRGSLVHQAQQWKVEGAPLKNGEGGEDGGEV